MRHAVLSFFIYTAAPCIFGRPPCPHLFWVVKASDCFNSLFLPCFVLIGYAGLCFICDIRYRKQKEYLFLHKKINLVEKTSKKKSMHTLPDKKNQPKMTVFCRKVQYQNQIRYTNLIMFCYSLYISITKFYLSFVAYS